MSKKSKIVILCVCVCALSACAFFVWRELNKPASDILTLYGNVDIRQVDLGFRVGGRIARVLVDEGDKVEPGQPMAILDKDILSQQRDEAEAKRDTQKANLARLERGYRTEEIAQARASVAAASATAENAAINLRRVQSMRSTNAISQRTLDDARAADQEAAARLRSARDNLKMLLSGYREEEVLAQKAALAEAEAGLKLAEIRLADSELAAPQKGVVLTRAREAGAIVGEGQTVYTLTLNDPVWIRAYVAEPELGLIKPGMAVEVGVDSLPGKRFPGNVGFISPTAEFTPKTVETREVRTHLVYRLRVQAEDPDNVMRQGMPITVYIKTAHE